MSKHTPGPWKRGQCDSSIIWAGSYRATDWKHDPITDGEGVPIAVADYPQPRPILGSDVRQKLDDEVEANAVLIAAAPDLLASLKALVACCEAYPAFQKESNPITFGRMEAARAIIAKAEGRS